MIWETFDESLSAILRSVPTISVWVRGPAQDFPLLLLSLGAHSHVDDYSGTLGGARKVHISALVTSP